MIGVRLKIGGHYRIRSTSIQDVMAGRLPLTGSSTTRMCLCLVVKVTGLNRKRWVKR